MMGRVTQGMMQNDFLHNLKNRNDDFQKKQTQLNSGMRVLLPSDDPANTINYMKWQGRQQDIKKYNEIINAYSDKLNIVDGHLESVSDSLHRARELMIQASNGTLEKFDRVAIASELDQIIRQVVSTANSEYKGNPLFGGTSTTSKPYRFTETVDADTNTTIVNNIEYFGNAQERIMDIGRDDRITSVAPGTTIFETTKTILEGTKDVSGYVASEDTRIMIEGIEIPILTGDNLEAIAQKINDAQLSVTASVETQQNGESFFRITSVSAREPWLQDTGGGTIFQDLGIIDPATEAPRNYSANAKIEKNSIFDTLIKVRDDLLNNDAYKIGGEDLGSVGQSLNNILRYRTYTGAVTERLEKTLNRNTNESLYLTKSSDTAVHTDYAKTITEFKMAEFAHQVALNIGSKLMPPTLLDFLR